TGPTTTGNQNHNATAANAPGGGSSGPAASSVGPTGTSGRGYAGGASGAYVKSVYIAGEEGSPEPGSTLNYTVGRGQAASSDTRTRAGASGRVQFSVQTSFEAGQEIIDSPGAGNFIVPPGYSTLIVEVWG